METTIYVTDQIGSSALSEPLDVKASIIDDEEKKLAALDKIIKKYGSMSKMFVRGSNENRAIIKIQERSKSVLSRMWMRRRKLV